MSAKAFTKEDLANISEAEIFLKSQRLVAIPTETVYGLAASASDPISLRKIFELKRRPFFDPLIVHVCDEVMAKGLCVEWSPVHSLLAEKFWPGPLTFILKKQCEVSDLITSGLETLGLRCPDHPLTLELIRRVGPLAAPSANHFGKTSPTTADHVREENFGPEVYVLEGGSARVGIESNIVEVVLLNNKNIELVHHRRGMISDESLSNILTERGYEVTFKSDAESLSTPGKLKHHYMPKVPLVLSSQKFPDAEMLARFYEAQKELPQEIEGVTLTPLLSPQGSVYWLKLPRQASSAARLLYSELRRGSQTGANLLAFIVDDFLLEDPEWIPILDRLKRASSWKF